MKKILRIFLIMLVRLFAAPALSSAQGTKEMNDAMFKQVETLVNAHNSDGLYALLNDNFKAKFTEDKFFGFLNGNIYPLGEIKESVFLNYDKGASTYKVTSAKAVLQYKIALDKEGKISALGFTPYKEQVALKSNTVATNNQMRTVFDKQVDSIARDYINKANTVGMCIGIVKDEAMFSYGYGETAKGNKHIPGADAIFEIGSVTKTFTATLLAYYVKEHKVSLSDPITKYLPDSVAANKDLQQITLLMLANHTSGLPRLPDNLFDELTDMQNPYKSYDREKLYAYLKTCKPATAPGVHYAYSNLAAGLLGNILETVSGLNYEQMVANIICKPLNMYNTCQILSEQQKALAVSVYDDRGEPVMIWDMNALAGAGALRSTMHDMLLYAAASMKKDETDLSAAMEMTHNITYSKEMSIGLGWHKKEIAGMACYWHNGGTGGSSSYIGFVPDRNIAVVVLSNAAERVDAAAERILELISNN